MDPNGNPTQQQQQDPTTPEREPSPNEGWSITLQQFLGTMISETMVNDYFNQRPPLLSEIEALRQRDRLHSVS